MDYEQGPYMQGPLRPLEEERRPPWGSIAGLLIAFIILIGGALWLLGNNDGGGDNDAETAASTTIATTTTTSLVPNSTAPTTTSELPADAASYGPPTLSTSSTVSTVGLDTVTFGMTIARAQNAAGTFMIPTGPVGECYDVIPNEGPSGVSFSVIEGTIERVDVTSGSVTTRSGIGVGSPEESVVDLFGDQIERSVNDDGTVDLIFVPSDAGDANYRVIFTVADGDILRYRAGKLPEVLLASACG